MERFPALRLILKLGRIGPAVLAVAAGFALIWVGWPTLGGWTFVLAPFVLAFVYFLFKSYVEIVQIITEMVH